jgi:putative peptidoglycan lipid II flippase
MLTSVIGVAAAPVLVWVLASGLKQSPHGFEAAVVMTRWMFPYIAFMSLVALAAGVLNTWKRFAVPAATPVLLNLAMIAAAWLGSPWLKTLGIEPIYALGGGVLVGGALQLGVQLMALKRLGFLPRIGLTWGALRTAWADPDTRNIAKLMVPALLGVSVAHISTIINTQIGVVLMPQLAAARAADDAEKYSAMLDWGLRIVVLLSVPCALALLTFAKPLVAVLYHYGAFTDRDVQQTSVALMGYGAGLLGLVAIKVLAPGYYASQDIRTPVKIAVAVLVITQLLNLALVPVLAHAGLALAIGLGALINALWLLVGLLLRGSYKPAPGWGLFALQVLAASALLTIFLVWAANAFNWTQLRAHSGQRIGLLALMVAGAGVIYLGAAWAAGLKLAQFMRR